MALVTCDACRFWFGSVRAGVCRRHAPAAGDVPLRVARWPETRGGDGCGDGEPRPQTEAPASPHHCKSCAYWDRPGIGIDPPRRGDRLQAWWQHAGWCRRYAPRPGVEIGEHAYWRATHADDFCFDGAPR